MGIFNRVKETAVQKLEEEKANIELKMLRAPKPMPKPRSTRMSDETAEDYMVRMQRARRTGRY
jgi:hypothetical protein